MATALSLKNWEIACLLIAARVDKSQGRVDWTQCLVEIAATEDIQIGQHLVQAGADVNAAWAKCIQQSWHGVDTIRATETLLQLGADPNVRDSNGQAVLHGLALSFPLLRSQAAIANRLVEAGADVNVQDDDGNTPLHYAIRRAEWIADDGSRAFVAALLDRGADPQIANRWGRRPIDSAALAKFCQERQRQVQPASFSNDAKE